MGLLSSFYKIVSRSSVPCLELSILSSIPRNTPSLYLSFSLSPRSLPSASVCSEQMHLRSALFIKEPRTGQSQPLFHWRKTNPHLSSITQELSSEVASWEAKFYRKTVVIVNFFVFAKFIHIVQSMTNPKADSLMSWFVPVTCDSHTESCSHAKSLLNFVPVINL